MDSIRVAIADDDEGMRLIEAKLIALAEGFDLVGEACNGDELMELVEREHPQVVFLDVEMPGKTGVECGRLIQDMDPSIVLIFATAHDDYMSEAFSVYAFDYLVKPFRNERVLQTLARVRSRLTGQSEAPLPSPHRETQARGDRIMLRHRDGLAFLDADEILLIQRENRATVVVAEGDRSFVTSETLAETEARLDPETFFRCHKSYIINLNKIRTIEPYGRWTYIVKLNGTRMDALITHEKYEELLVRFS
ncbi:MAG: response regulator transcription factor [Clostridia bacterium]|nr:response regulator transcription factor [Clostridia bacterium]MBR4459235.1 response regulator transcription factor [Clostridia bacterium]